MQLGKTPGTKNESKITLSFHQNLELLTIEFVNIEFVNEKLNQLRMDSNQ
tara:strand:- start:3212 stop:3361 length:150 start_codon:yes stop_codon:yes gene_type:complete